MLTNYVYIGRTKTKTQMETVKDINKMTEKECYELMVECRWDYACASLRLSANHDVVIGESEKIFDKGYAYKKESNIIGIIGFENQ